MSARSVLVLTFAWAATLSASGCQTPCAADEDCPELWGCVDGVCAQECIRNEDCALEHLCDGRGRCIEDAAGSITWVAPSAGAQVGARFDGAVRVRFRGAEGLVRVMRDARDPGDSCAPVPPLELRVVGDPDDTFEQEIPLPGLYAGGRAFSLVASLDVAGGRTSAPLPLLGPDQGASPLSWASPSEGALIGEPLLIELRTTLDATPTTALVRTEPEQGASAVSLTLDPSPAALASLLVPVARGRQAIVIEGETADGGAFSCGRGFVVDEAGEGLELALWYLAGPDSEALVRLRTQLDDGTDATVCTALAPDGPCTVRREAAELGASGDEILILSPPRNALVHIAVVPSAVSSRVVTGVRVSYQGRHVAFLGPFALNPERGEVWLAGDVAFVDGVPVVTPRFDLTIGSPF